MSLDRVARKWQKVLDSKAPRVELIPALLGQSNTAGSASVSSKESWCYARVGNSFDVSIQVINRVTAHRNGLAVWVAELEDTPGTLQVIKERYVYFEETPGQGSLAPHRSQHEWGRTDGSDDIVYIRSKQMHDCAVRPQSTPSMYVDVKEGVVVAEGEVWYYSGGSIDLSSYIPSTGWVWVTISLGDEDTGLTATLGQEKIDLTLADIPDAPAGHWRLAAVQLKPGTSSITDWPGVSMITDLRYGGRGTASTFLDLSDVDTTEYVGEAGNYVIVNAAEDRLELSAPTFAVTDLSDGPGALGDSGQVFAMKSTEDAADWMDQVRTLVYVVGNGSDAIAQNDGDDIPVKMDWPGAVLAWDVQSSVSGSATFDVKKYTTWDTTGASMPGAGGTKPNLSSAKDNGTDEDWDTTTFAAGNTIQVYATTNATSVTRAVVTIKVKRTGE